MPLSNLSVSEKLYLELIELNKDRLKEYLKNYPMYESQLNYDSNFNHECYNLMYTDERHDNPISRQDFWPRIENLHKTCSLCWAFYLKPRNNSVKSLDIHLGKKFEESLMEFFRAKGFEVQRADKERKNYPDIKIIKNNITYYIELKYLSAPFLMVYQKLKGRECYEGSTTLDVGKKISAQRELVENKISDSVYYVYWIDFPCIKGIFFMPSDKVYEYIDKKNGVEFTRKERSGDFINTTMGKREMSQLDKVYLPLLEMGNFEELMINLSK